MCKNVACRSSHYQKSCKILGNLEALFEAVTYGALFYSFMEIEKINVLTLSKEKSDVSCVLSPAAKNEACCLRQNIQNSSQKMISAPTLDYIKHTDASNLGWVAYDEDKNTTFRWSDSEKTYKLLRTPGNKTSHKIIFAA